MPGHSGRLTNRQGHALALGFLYSFGSRCEQSSVLNEFAAVPKFGHSQNDTHPD